MATVGWQRQCCQVDLRRRRRLTMMCSRPVVSSRSIGDHRVFQQMSSILRRMVVMNTTTATSSEPVLKHLDRLIPDLEALYKDIHSHPELSMQETRTAGLAANWLRDAGYEVTTGVEDRSCRPARATATSPTVMLRADMDALPVEDPENKLFVSPTASRTRYLSNPPA